VTKTCHRASDSVLSLYNGFSLHTCPNIQFNLHGCFTILLKRLLFAGSIAYFYAENIGPPKKNFNPFNLTVPHMSFVSTEDPIIKCVKRTSCIIYFAWLKTLCYIMDMVLRKISYAGAAL
jgi:hypothetical protein